MQITEKQLINQFKNTVGKSEELVEAVRLQKWLIENEANIPKEWYNTAAWLCSAIIKERRRVWMERIDNKINSGLDR